MKLHHPRFTVRWLMIAVAIGAVAIGGWLWGERRRTVFERLTYSHKVQGTPTLSDPMEEIITTEYHIYHQELAEKYEYASRYPWFPVAPDPPEPELKWPPKSDPDEPRQADPPAARSSYGLIVMPPQDETGAP